MWAVQQARAQEVISNRQCGGMGRDRESEVTIGLECTAGWSPQTGQSFLKSKLCLRRKQNKWVGGVECYSEHPWNFLGGHQVESSVVRVGQVGAGAGTKSRV